MSHARGARKSSQAQQTRDGWRKENSEIHIVSREASLPIILSLTFIISVLKNQISTRREIQSSM